jgi:ribosome maturation factor RimP
MADALERRIESLISPTMESMGYGLVRVRLFGQQRLRLQVMIERLDEAPLDVDDCAEASRAISAVLDVDDPIVGSYTLEVSSPGIDRPLVRLADFTRFAGFAAKIELDAPIDGRRRFAGRLAGVNEDAVKLTTETGEVALPYERIAKAKLVLTDDLLAASAARPQETTR